MVSFFFLVGAGGAFAAENEKVDAFPADWTADDFAVGVSGTEVGKGLISETKVVAPAPSIVTFTGVNFKVEDLPRIGMTLERTGAVGMPKTVTLTLPDRGTFETENAASAPKNAAELAAYGVQGAGWKRELWGKSSGTEVVAVLGTLGTKNLTPEVRDVVTELLLQAGAPPADLGESWLGVRARALSAMGRDEAAWMLWKEVAGGRVTADAELMKGWAGAALLAGRVEEACKVVRERVQMVTEKGGFWTQAALVCPLLERNAAGLELAKNLATDALPTLPPLLRAAVSAVLADKPMAANTALPARMDALTGALLVGYPALLTDNVIARLPDVGLRRLVRSAELPLRVRALAAEVLANTSGLKTDADAVAMLYGAFTLGENALRDPLGTARADVDGVRARATLWQAAKVRPEGVEKAPVSLRAAAWHAWRGRVQSAGWGRLAEMLGPDAVTLAPDATLAWLAPMVARDAVVRGYRDVAWAWGGEISPTTLASSVLGVVNGGKDKDWEVWRGAVTSTTLPMAARWLGVAQAVNVKVPDTAWARVASVVQAPVAAPNPAWVASVEGPLARGETGLALLRALTPQLAEDPAAPGWLGLRAKVLRAAGAETAAAEMGRRALLPASGYVALPPAPPVMTAGTAPVEKGVEIGGAKKGEKYAPIHVNDGMILPPPRVPVRPTKPKI